MSLLHLLARAQTRSTPMQKLVVCLNIILGMGLMLLSSMSRFESHTKFVMTHWIIPSICLVYLGALILAHSTRYIGREDEPELVVVKNETKPLLVQVEDPATAAAKPVVTTMTTAVVDPQEPVLPTAAQQPAQTVAPSVHRASTTAFAVQQQGTSPLSAVHRQSTI